MRPPASRLPSLVGYALLLLLAGGCDRPPGPSETSANLRALEPVPYPSLEGSEAGVREQVEEKQRALEQLLAAPGDADAGELARTFSELGLVYVVYDFPDAAVVCFDNARRLAPSDPQWAYLGGYVRKLKGDLDEAIPLLERSLELDPTFVPALLRLGRAHLELGRLAEARDRFEAALAADPSSAAAFEGLGKIAVAEGESERAVGAFRRALELEPDASSLHYALAQAYRDLGRLDEARAELELSGDAVVPIPDPLISPLALLGESVQLSMLQANEAVKDEKYEVAVAGYQRVLEKDPSNFIAYKGKAYALEKLGDLPGAVRSLKDGLETGTTGSAANDARERAEIHRILGGLEALEGRDSEAVRHFSASLELAPDQSGTRMKLANALARLGRFAEAVDHFDRLLRDEPEFAAVVLVRRATALINLGRGDEALADFERAVALEPDDAQLRVRYADALEHLGRRSEAAAERRRLATDPDASAAAAAERGNQALRAGRLEEALAAYAEALELDPQLPDIGFRRGTTLAQLGRLEEAVREFRRAIELDPRHAAARHAEITSLILLERYGESRVRLNEAMRVFTLDARLAHVQARLLATCPDARVRDGRIASEVARRLVEVVDEPRVRETQALAFAAAGDFDRAVELQSRLVTEAEQSGNAELAADFRAKLEVLRERRAWSARGPQEILNATLGS